MIMTFVLCGSYQMALITARLQVLSDDKGEPLDSDC